MAPTTFLCFAKNCRFKYKIISENVNNSFHASTIQDVYKTAVIHLVIFKMTFPFVRCNNGGY